VPAEVLVRGYKPPTSNNTPQPGRATCSPGRNNCKVLALSGGAASGSAFANDTNTVDRYPDGPLTLQRDIAIHRDIKREADDFPALINDEVIDDRHDPVALAASGIEHGVIVEH
jgi:hypothetical protein